ncbi:MAG: hypothetical protein PWK00_06420, partial [Coxiella burnetii]|nr:hypothetical protein [Coxiella burnetii]
CITSLQQTVMLIDSPLSNPQLVSLSPPNSQVIYASMALLTVKMLQYFRIHWLGVSDPQFPHW